MIINSLRIISEISGRNYQIVRKNLKPKKKNKKININQCIIYKQKIHLKTLKRQRRAYYTSTIGCAIGCFYIEGFIHVHVYLVMCPIHGS